MIAVAYNDLLWLRKVMYEICYLFDCNLKKFTHNKQLTEIQDIYVLWILVKYWQHVFSIIIILTLKFEMKLCI